MSYLHEAVNDISTVPWVLWMKPVGTLFCFQKHLHVLAEGEKCFYKLFNSIFTQAIPSFFSLLEFQEFSVSTMKTSVFVCRQCFFSVSYVQCLILYSFQSLCTSTPSLFSCYDHPVHIYMEITTAVKSWQMVIVSNECFYTRRGSLKC